MSNLFTDIELNLIRSKVEEKFLSSHLIELLSLWVESSGMQSIIQLRQKLLVSEWKGEKRGNPKIKITNQFIDIISQYISDEDSFTWENYCKIMHTISAINNLHFHFPLREMVGNLYLFCSEYSVIEEVRYYIHAIAHLFLVKEYIKGKEVANTFIEQNVQTYFPLLSKPNQVVQAQCESSSRKNVFFTANFFINTNNCFIYKLIKSFIKYLTEEIGSNNKKAANLIYYRLFYAYFEESLSPKKVNNILDFDEATFKQQLFFFKILFQEHGLNTRFLKMVLFKFYRFIDDFYYSLNGSRLFTSVSFNRDIMTKPKYLRCLEEGYEYVLLNTLEDPPQSDKWYVVGKDSSHVREKNNATFDFTFVQNEELRKDLKRYIWHNDYTIEAKKIHFLYLVSFLNEADNYYQDQLEVSFIQDSEEIKMFSSSFLFLYQASISSNKTYNNNTKNAIVNYLRQYLNYYQNQYNISTIAMHQLSIFAEDEYGGGTPISEEDFKVIQKALKETLNNAEAELLLIAFQLSLTTKLRIGEVFSLRRDCIVSVVEDKGFGIIRYQNKTSHGKFVEEILLLPHIRLILRAIELSQNAFQKADHDLKCFVFIGFHENYAEQIVNLNRRYNHTFSKIISRLYKEGKIQKKYTPYNARDAYIDNAWQLVEDGKISTLEIGVITGNTAKVAHKHYRNRENVKRYVEALWDVTIGETAVSGEIFKSEDKIRGLPPVQEEAGACSNDECIKKSSEEDSYFKCVTCNKFVTTVERIRTFEKRINEFQIRREEANSIVERDFYISLIELYGAYLTEMYLMTEDKNAQPN